MTEESLTITDQKGRLDKVVADAFTEYTRTQVSKWIDEGVLTVNKENKKPNYKVRPDDVISFVVP